MFEVSRILSCEEVAKLLHRSKKTVWRWWQVDKTFPPPILINGRAVGWRISDYELWEKGDWEKKK